MGLPTLVNPIKCRLRIYEIQQLFICKHNFFDWDVYDSNIAPWTAVKPADGSLLDQEKVLSIISWL